jgi:hypothetical protein
MKYIRPIYKSIDWSADHADLAGFRPHIWILTVLTSQSNRLSADELTAQTVNVTGCCIGLTRPAPSLVGVSPRFPNKSLLWRSCASNRRRAGKLVWFPDLGLMRER